MVSVGPRPDDLDRQPTAEVAERLRPVTLRRAMINGWSRRRRPTTTADPRPRQWTMDSAAPRSQHGSVATAVTTRSDEPASDRTSADSSTGLTCTKDREPHGWTTPPGTMAWMVRTDRSAGLKSREGLPPDIDELPFLASAPRYVCVDGEARAACVERCCAARPSQ